MTDNTIELKCSETVKDLLEKYKDNEYMIQRIYNHIVTYLPNTLENEMKNHEKRVNRTNYLTNEQQIFIQVFLSKNKYFYLPNNNFFYEYDGEKYLIVKEDDVIHKLLSTISKDRVLLQWKHKTKMNIIRLIKDRTLFSSLPETDTIQKCTECIVSYHLQHQKFRQVFSNRYWRQYPKEKFTIDIFSKYQNEATFE